MRIFDLVKRGINVQPLVDAIEENNHLWDEITIRQEFPGTPHVDTQTIFVRGPEEFTFEKYQQDVGSYDYSAMTVLLNPLVDMMTPIFQSLEVSQLGRILIVKLAPGGEIEPHIDEGKYADHFSRFHLCLTSNRLSALVCGGKSQKMQPGELWWFDHKQEHSAYNRGSTPRTHLIFDCVSKQYP